MEERLNKLEDTLTNLVAHVKNTHELINEIVTTANQNFEKIDARLASIETELSKLSGETTSNFSKVGDQLDGIHNELSKINVTTRYEEEFQNLKIVQ